MLYGSMIVRWRRQHGIRHQQTSALGQEGFRSKLYVDKDDEKILKDAVIQRGYNYWWLVKQVIDHMATEKNWMATFQLYRIIDKQMALARVGVEWDPWKIAAQQNATAQPR
eukprot:s734_g11.t1